MKSFNAIPEGINQTSQSLADALPDNATYYWRVRAFNAAYELYSPWAYASFRVNLANDVPSVPVVISPTQDEVLTAVPVQWIASSSTDADNDALTYTVSVYSDAALTTLVEQSASLTDAGTGQISWTMTQALSDGDYYGVVSVDDGLGGQATSEVRHLSVQLVSNVPPQAPSIAQPAASSEVTSNQVTITVQASAQGTVAESIDVEVDTSNGFDSPDLQQLSLAVSESAPSASASLLLYSENATYYVRARSTASSINSDWVMSSFILNAQNEAPSVPSLLNPGDGAWVDVLMPTLEVAPATDPDGDVLTYEYQVLDGSDPISGYVVVAQGAVSQTLWVTNVVLDNHHTYQWQVRATDEHGLSSNWSTMQSFFTNENGYNDAPIAELSLGSSETQVYVMAPGPLTYSWQVTDPDSDAQISVYVDTDASGADGTLIFGPGSEVSTWTEQNWDLSGVAPGDYYLYAVATDGENTIVYYLPTTITVLADASIVRDNTNISPWNFKTQDSALAWLVETDKTGYWGTDYRVAKLDPSVTYSETDYAATWYVYPEGGTYDIYARWPAHPDNATQATYELSVNSFSSGLGSNQVVVVDQTQNGNQWNYLGRISMFTGNGMVELNANGQVGGHLVADAIKLVPYVAPGEAPGTHTMDEVDLSFYSAGVCTVTDANDLAGYWGNGFKRCQLDPLQTYAKYDFMAVWELKTEQTDTYEVYARWPASSANGTNVSFSLGNYTGTTLTVAVDQTQQGNQWVYLGDVTAYGNVQVTVEALGMVGGDIVVDAIKLVRKP